MYSVAYIPIVLGLVGLLAALGLYRAVLGYPEGTGKVVEIASQIHRGALVFMRREYLYLVIFVIVVGAVILVSDLGWRTMVAFLVGALSSATAGFIGMYAATKANVRTTTAAKDRGAAEALTVSFYGGSIMGLSVAAMGLLGLGVLYLFYGGDPETSHVIHGFGMGASSVALFARVGGGIFTKSADVGADLVGKIEVGIPEDDPRNPGVIADNVGDNVGDVAGMGADLFESYVGSIIATIALAAVGAGALGVDAPIEFDDNLFILPILIAAIGIFASIIGTFMVRTGEGANMGRLLWSLRTGIFGAGILVLIGTAISVTMLGLDFKLFWIVVVGLVAGQIIGTSSEVFTSYEYRFTRNLAETAETGPATVIIGGLGLGMLSTVVPAIVVVVAMWFANDLAGTYGVALAAVGMLSTLGITLATDAYGPVADNAGGIAEQAHLPPEVRERTDALDSLGNTTAATGKGFAIGSAVLTALALMAAYSVVVDNINEAKALEEGVAFVKISFDLSNVDVLMGLFVGSLTPFLFAALTMQAVGRAAMAMVNEVRRQFREIPGLLEGTADADYARAVDISTNGAMKEMVVPGILAVAAPIIVGAILGPEALGGLLIGSIASGFLLAVMMANAGGAWDNAKKYIEAGAHGGKGSEPHSAAVVGDTVGDPFKDTSGPALNILIKLMSIVALVFAPIFL